MSMAKSGTLSGTKKVGMFVKKKSTNFPSQPTGFLKGILAIKEEYTLCVEKAWIQNLFTDFLSVSQVP